jgi:Bifunctional DNA primase/polymerase, N-terminal
MAEQLLDQVRRRLLEAYGRFCGERRFAICWTKTNRADRGDPKKVTTEGWQFTRPLAGGDVGVTAFGRAITCNPAINLRTSRLIGIESDGAEELAQIKALGLPATLTEQSSLATKLHFYFRPPPELEVVPKVSFRFEAGTLTAASNNYYICAPALHPSGAVYTHLPGPGPSEVEIAVLPLEIYRALLARVDAERTARRCEGGPIATGSRHERLREISYAMRRYSGASLAAIEAALLEENKTFCVPPKEERLVRALAAYTYENIRPLRDDR